MKALTRLSKKATQFCELGGYDAKKVRELMKTSSFSLQKCETAKEMEEEGVSSSFPYLFYNPFGLNIKK